MLPILLLIARAAMLSPRLYAATLAGLRLLQRQGHKTVTWGQLRDAMIAAGYGDCVKEHLRKITNALGF